MKQVKSLKTIRRATGGILTQVTFVRGAVRDVKEVVDKISSRVLETQNQVRSIRGGVVGISERVDRLLAGSGSTRDIVGEGLGRGGKIDDLMEQIAFIRTEQHRQATSNDFTKAMLDDPSVVTRRQARALHQHLTAVHDTIRGIVIGPLDKAEAILHGVRQTYDRLVAFEAVEAAHHNYLSQLIGSLACYPKPGFPVVGWPDKPTYESAQATLRERMEANEAVTAKFTEARSHSWLLEQGRTLASERDDLIADGANPDELAVPLAPYTLKDLLGHDTIRALVDDNREMTDGSGHEDVVTALEGIALPSSPGYRVGRIPEEDGPLRRHLTQRLDHLDEGIHEILRRLEAMAEQVDESQVYTDEDGYVVCDHPSEDGLQRCQWRKGHSGGEVFVPELHSYNAINLEEEMRHASKMNFNQVVTATFTEVDPTQWNRSGRDIRDYWNKGPGSVSPVHTFWMHSGGPTGDYYVVGGRFYRDSDGHQVEIGKDEAHGTRPILLGETPCEYPSPNDEEVCVWLKGHLGEGHSWSEIEDEDDEQPVRRHGDINPGEEV